MSLQGQKKPALSVTPHFKRITAVLEKVDVQACITSTHIPLIQK